MCQMQPRRETSSKQITRKGDENQCTYRHLTQLKSGIAHYNKSFNSTQLKGIAHYNKSFNSTQLTGIAHYNKSFNSTQLTGTTHYNKSFNSTQLTGTTHYNKAFEKQSINRLQRKHSVFHFITNFSTISPSNKTNIAAFRPNKVYSACELQTNQHRYTSLYVLYQGGENQQKPMYEYQGTPMSTSVLNDALDSLLYDFCTSSVLHL